MITVQNRHSATPRPFEGLSEVGVDRYVFFRADTDYCRSSRPITDILMSGVKMKMNAKINNNKSSDKKKTFFKCF